MCMVGLFNFLLTCDYRLAAEEGEILYETLTVGCVRRVAAVEG